MSFHAGGVPPAPYAPGSSPPPAARRRGWGRIVLGILGVLLLALPLLATGIVLLLVQSRWEALDPEAQGRVPGEVSLDAEDGATYVIALGTGIVNDTGGGRSFHTGVARDVRCTITHPDGDTDEVRGDQQGTSVTKAGSYASVGRFEGRGGATNVECRATSRDVLGEERDLPMVVHETNRTLQHVGIGLLVGGVVAALGAVVLILWGARGRSA